MTIRIIASSEFVTTYADAAPGDTIIVTDSDVIDLGTDFTFDKGVTIRSSLSVIMAADPLGSGLGASAPTHPARFTRNLRFQCLAYVNIPLGQTLRIEDASFTFDEALWPDWVGAGETWASKSLTGRAVLQGLQPTNLGRVELVRPEIYAGYGPTKAQYTNEKLPDYYSPITYYSPSPRNGLYSKVQDATYTDPFPEGHGDDTGTLPNERAGLLYNAVDLSPFAILGGWSGLELINPHIHDIAYGISIALYDGTNIFRCVGGWFERIYSDCITPIGNARYMNVFEISGNLFPDGAIANGKDLANPHADGAQPHDQSDPLAVIRRFRFNNNFHFSPPDARVIKPLLFVNATYRLLGLEARNNIGLGVGKFIYLDSCQDSYVRNNQGLNPAWQADASFVADITSLIEEDTGLDDPVFRSSGLFRDNIAESISGQNADVLIGNVVVPDRDAVAQAAVYVGDMETAPTTPWEAFETYKRKAAYADKGPQFSTLDAFLAGYEDFTGEPVWARVPPDLGTATKNIVWVSAPAVVHGGNIGDTLAIDGLDPALEWRELDLDDLDPDLATEVQTWSAASGTITIGNRLQLRTTTPDSDSTVLQLGYSVGGTEFTWSVITESANVWPVATIPDTTCLRKAAVGLAGLTNASDGFALAWRFASSALGDNKHVLSLPGSNVRQIYISGSQSGLNWLFRDTAANTVTSGSIAANIAAIEAGVMYELVMSFDLTQSTATAGLIVYGTGGVRITSFTSSVWNASLYNPRFDDVNWSLFGSSTGNFNPGDLAYFALWGQPIDWTNPLTLSKLGIDFIGPAGEGPTGGTPALIFIPGVAAAIDGGTGNRGTGGAFIKGGTAPGAITEAVAAPWPPPLTLYTTVLTETAIVGRPIEVLVQATGTPKEVVVTPTPSGVAGDLDEVATTMPVASNGVIVTFSPSAAGTLTIAWANDGGYTDPADTVIEVIAGTFAAFRPRAPALALCHLGV